MLKIYKGWTIRGYEATNLDYIDSFGYSCRTIVYEGKKGDQILEAMDYLSDLMDLIDKAETGNVSA